MQLSMQFRDFVRGCAELGMMLTRHSSCASVCSFVLRPFSNFNRGQELRTAKKAVQEAAPGAVVEDECLDVCGGAIHVTVFKIEGGKSTEVCPCLCADWGWHSSCVIMRLTMEGMNSGFLRFVVADLQD